MPKRSLLLSATLLCFAAGLSACDLLPPRGESGDGLRMAAADDGALPDSLRRSYRYDAAQLALRYVLQEEHDTTTVALPESLVTALYNALIHVYNARAYPERDSVAYIHAFPRYATQELIVAVDSAASWADAWRRGDSLTGYAGVDTLVQRYSLRLTSYYPSAGHQSAVLRADEPLNTLALARQFAGIDGVLYADPNGVCCDGPDVTATRYRGGWELTYSTAWGDCPAGCIHRRFWTFRVETSGRVVFVGRHAW